MPKASMHEYGDLSRGKRDIRMAWKVGTVQAEA
jgi:hypothetical protein